MKADALRALETTEKVIAALTVLDERDSSIDRLITSISDDRARLLAATFRDATEDRAKRRAVSLR